MSEKAKNNNQTTILVLLLLSIFFFIVAIIASLPSNNLFLTDNYSPLNCGGSGCSVAGLIFIEAFVELGVPIAAAITFLVISIQKIKESQKNGRLRKDIRVVSIAAYCLAAIEVIVLVAGFLIR